MIKGVQPLLTLSTDSLRFQDWALLDYKAAEFRQLELVELTSRENIPGFLVFCTHQPVVTLGRATKPGDVFGWDGPIVEVARGGRATYHGPSQLLVYPIVNLKNPRRGRGPQEVQGFLRDFENAIVRVLAAEGIESQGRSLQKKSLQGDEAEETGVWVEEKKIASLGLGVKNWVTFHGAAINLTEDPNAFFGMKPCGFERSVMTNIERVLGYKLNAEKFKLRLKQELLQVL